MKRASLKQNIFALYLLQISNYLIPLITLPYLVRTLGAAHYGLISFAYAMTYFMVLFVDAGYNLTASRELAGLHNPLAELPKAREIFWSTQLVKSVMVLACWVLLCALVFAIPALRKDWPVYLLSFLTVLGSLAFPVWVFQGFEQMRFTTMLFLGGRLLAAAAILLFVKSSDDYVLATFLQSGATLFSGILAWPILARQFHLHWVWPGRAQLWKHFHHGRGYFISDFIFTALNNSSVFIIGLFNGKELVGVFAAIEKLTRAIASMFAPVQRAFFPRVAATYKQDEHAGRALAGKLITLVTGSAVIGAISVIVLAPWVLHFVFGQKFSAYADLLRILSVWFALMVCNAAISEYAYVARRLTAELAHLQHLSSAVLLIGVPVAAMLQANHVLEAVACVMLLSQACLLGLLWMGWKKQSV